jgi:hypothetical protein
MVNIYRARYNETVRVVLTTLLLVLLYCTIPSLAPNVIIIVVQGRRKEKGTLCFQGEIVSYTLQKRIVTRELRKGERKKKEKDI